jgi:hypothetical protein
MRKRIPDGVLDEMIDCYVDWREESERVESAYRRWATAPSPHASRAFATYAAALDREELASISYAQVIRRILRLVARDRRRRFAAARRPVGARGPNRRRRRTGPLPRDSYARAGARQRRAAVATARRRRA